MRIKPTLWLLLSITLCSTGQNLLAYPLEQDIVKINPASEVFPNDRLPGLVTGQRIWITLNDALDVVRDGVPKAAEPELVEIDREIRDLAAGRSPDLSLPAGYRVHGETWLPVKAEILNVYLDAPDLRMRAEKSDADNDNGLGNLPAQAQRVVWLPLIATANKIEATLPLLAAGNAAHGRAQSLLEDAVQGIQHRLDLLDKPLITAYYTVESIMAKIPNWDPSFSTRLRHAAVSLSKNPQLEKIAGELQQLGEQSRPDYLKLQAMALKLRRLITAKAKGLKE